ncbi:hypothetical protein LJR084_002749 [Variovorax sp. LjRoot84]|uniref:hypothetical protein n=1 Tax=Variovorax sp. LjRoot84 TaxID=3342340 RepID=UPI003ECF5C70
MRLSFQRFLRPTSRIASGSLPSSLGALPVGLGRQGDLIVPTADNEAFWVGLELARAAQPITLRLSVELRSGDVLDALGAAPSSALTVPPTRHVGGFTHAGSGLRAFARGGGENIDGCVRLVFRAAILAVESEPFSTVVRLVDYAGFTAESGMAPPSPLDPDAGFQGWRLP